MNDFYEFKTEKLENRFRLLEANKINNQNSNTLNTLLSESLETNNIGEIILKQLAFQREQLLNINLNNIDETIHISNHLLNAIEYPWWHPYYWLYKLKIQLEYYLKLG